MATYQGFKGSIIIDGKVWNHLTQNDLTGYGMNEPSKTFTTYQIEPYPPPQSKRKSGVYTHKVVLGFYMYNEPKVLAHYLDIQRQHLIASVGQVMVPGLNYTLRLKNEVEKGPWNDDRTYTDTAFLLLQDIRQAGAGDWIDDAYMPGLPFVVPQDGLELEATPNWPTAAEIAGYKDDSMPTAPWRFRYHARAAAWERTK